jgi:hypothetical protein
MAYEAAGDLVHALQALFAARAFQAEKAVTPDRTIVDRWRGLAADSERQWKLLEPGDRPAVEAFTAQWRRQIDELRRAVG